MESAWSDSICLKIIQNSRRLYGEIVEAHIFLRLSNISPVQPFSRQSMNRRKALLQRLATVAPPIFRCARSVRVSLQGHLFTRSDAALFEGEIRNTMTESGTNRAADQLQVDLKEVILQNVITSVHSESPLKSVPSIFLSQDDHQGVYLQDALKGQLSGLHGCDIPLQSADNIEFIRIEVGILHLR